MIDVYTKNNIFDISSIPTTVGAEDRFTDREPETSGIGTTFQKPVETSTAPLQGQRACITRGVRRTNHPFTANARPRAKYQTLGDSYGYQ